MNVRVTVLCMTYNHEKFIRNALDGFVSQKTDFRFKVIVHDDASQDATPEIIKEYAEKYPDIIKPILQKVNTYSTIGVRERQKRYIFPELEGDYIAMCEGDDYWCDCRKLQRQVDFLDKHPEYSASVHNSYILNMKTGKKSIFNPSDSRDRDMTVEDVISGVWGKFQTSSLMYRTGNIFERPDYFNKVSFGDYPRAIQLATAGKIRYFADKMSVYRLMSNADSWTVKNVKKFDVSARTDNVRKEIAMLKEVRRLNPQYSKLINITVRNKTYHMLFMTGKRSEIKRNKYFNAMYRKEPPARKMKFILRYIQSFFAK